MWSDRQAIEVFHLLFLRSFGGRVDKALFALKGGCNLRFYHRSIRYSEDMDLDIRTMAVGTLRSNVEAILASDAFRHALRAQGLAIESSSAPKQTATTQRWKIALRSIESRASIPTKIEFSRRALDAGAALAPVDPAVLRAYRLFSIIVQRYDMDAAFLQKVAALASRSIVQARDVFDLKLLIDAGAAPQLAPETRKLLPQAIDNALSIGFEEFAGQVVAFLEPEHQGDYATRAAWETLQEQVIDTLQGLRP
jgi:predicted nucleotidyltransferase component of viral defense system